MMPCRRHQSRIFFIILLVFVILLLLVLLVGAVVPQPPPRRPGGGAREISAAPTTTTHRPRRGGAQRNVSIRCAITPAATKRVIVVWRLSIRPRNFGPGGPDGSDRRRAEVWVDVMAGVAKRRFFGPRAVVVFVKIQGQGV